MLKSPRIMEEPRTLVGNGTLPRREQLWVKYRFNMCPQQDK
jgi:hypothetical protein